MKPHILCAAFLAFFAILATGSLASDVVVLTDSNFLEKTSNGQTWFIEFYAPWCGHCKKLAPVWEAFATRAKERNVNVAKVDCTQNTEVPESFGVSSYPTLIFLHDGKIREYRGQRSAEDLDKFAFEDGWKFVKPSLAPHEAAAKNLPSAQGNVATLTSANFTEAMRSGEWLIKFYAPWCGHCKNLAPTWEKLASKMKGKVNVAKVDCTAEKLICVFFDVSGYPTIKFIKDGLIRDYSGGRTTDDFVKYVESDYQSVQPKSIPSWAFIFLSEAVLYAYEGIEPIVLWMVQTENLGWVFALFTLTGLVLGFILGRLTAPGPRFKYVVPKEFEKQYKKMVQAQALEEWKQQNKEQNGKQQQKEEEENKDPAKAEDLVPVSPGNKKAIKRRIKVVEVDKPKE